MERCTLASSCMLHMGVDSGFVRTRAHVRPSRCGLTWFTASVMLVCSSFAVRRHKERHPHIGHGCCCSCPAPGRHPASPSHSNHGRHCLQTRWEKATHRFYCEAHTLDLKKAFTPKRRFPVERRDLFGVAQRLHTATCNTHTHTQSKWTGLQNLLCLRWGIFKGSGFSHAATLRMWPRCVIKVSVSSLHNPIKAFLSHTHYVTIAHTATQHFFWWLLWFLLAQIGTKDNSQTTGRRWTQPAQFSLLTSSSVFLSVSPTPKCLQSLAVDDGAAARLWKEWGSVRLHTQQEKEMGLTNHCFLVPFEEQSVFHRDRPSTTAGEPEAWTEPADSCLMIQNMEPQSTTRQDNKAEPK